VIHGTAIAALQALGAAQQGPIRVRATTGLAEVGTPGQARHTASAQWDIREDDMIARPEVVHPGTEIVNDPGRLVAKDDRHLAWAQSVDDREVGVTQPCGNDLDSHLSRARVVQDDLFER